LNTTYLCFYRNIHNDIYIEYANILSHKFVLYCSIFPVIFAGILVMSIVNAMYYNHSIVYSLDYIITS